MDLSVKRDTVRINELVFDGTADQPVESDVLLPDYCPDIARILNTEACARIDTKMLESDRLTVSGTFCVKVIYIPDNSSSIRCFNYESAFNHIFDASGVGRDDMARVKARVDYVNCRPISPRRLQVKASVSIRAKVWSKRDEEVITGCDDDKVEMLSRQIKMSSPIGFAERPFSVEDELEVGYGKPAVASIIRCDAVAVVQDYKVIANKIITKGELVMHTLYAPEAEDSRLEVMDHSIPLSQIIDLEGVDEQSVVSVTFEVRDLKIDMAVNADGENRIMAVKADIDAVAGARGVGEFAAVADAYSPVYEMDIQMKPISVEYITDVIKTNETVRISVEAPGEGLSNVTDCVVRPETVSAKAEGKNLVINGEMAVSAMASDLQGGPVCIEKSVPFTLSEPMSSPVENVRCEPDLKVVANTFSIVSGGIDIRCDCALSAVVFGIDSKNVVADMTLDETKPREARQKTLTLYFADNGENLWNIAKRFNTSMDAIKRENNLEEDTLPERSMLLIPKKHCAKGC
ncbi:MAG TPA: SPOCS domain-containing protein [Ruminiclostridium sp.]|nr:SPOCS domain-containing protein [Ruminiclostridium sp.]